VPWSKYLALAVPAGDGGHGHPATVQVLLQFVCGYHDVNLRDSTGVGHGRLIAAHATPQARDRWLPRLLAGAIPGIAVTEQHGGSQVYATATRATRAGDGTWRVTGIKTWISRLTEAAVFCAFFAAPDGWLTAAAIDARADGLSRRLITPAGLSGWSWGELRLDSVTVRPCDILGQPGEGMPMLRDHFARYRPLVTATALGAAAAVHNQTADLLASRRQGGIIARVRDNALITLGRNHGIAHTTGPVLGGSHGRTGGVRGPPGYRETGPRTAVKNQAPQHHASPLLQLKATRSDASPAVRISGVLHSPRSRPPPGGRKRGGGESASWHRTDPARRAGAPCGYRVPVVVARR
jgi:hypothetical protein